MRPPGIEPGSSAVSGQSPWKADVLDQARLRPHKWEKGDKPIKSLPVGTNRLRYGGKDEGDSQTVIKLNVVTGETRFQCQRCTRCCSLDVMLSGREMRELQPHVDRAWRTTSKRRGRRGPICSLLEGADCSVYSERPLLCRLYPFFAIPTEDLMILGENLPDGASVLESGPGKNYFFIYDDACPGMGKGSRVEVGPILQLVLQHLEEMEAPD